VLREKAKSKLKPRKKTGVKRTGEGGHKPHLQSPRKNEREKNICQKHYEGMGEVKEKEKGLGDVKRIIGDSHHNIRRKRGP